MLYGIESNNCVCLTLVKTRPLALPPFSMRGPLSCSPHTAMRTFQPQGAWTAMNNQGGRRTARRIATTGLGVVAAGSFLAPGTAHAEPTQDEVEDRIEEIGRASCRERV